ncbi:MAG: hypothetical protein IRY97_05615, partial [Thermomicrobiaceae bacterium]|nr:hypothetical protein [Thermomicrobiaceae bacterium]
MAVVEQSMARARLTRPRARLPLGLALIAVWWPIAWAHLRPVSDYYFFPLWLGYILTLDGIVEWRTGTSLWRRDHRRFVGLFLVSVPFWWLFEWLNGFIQNWHYLTPRHYGTVEYFLLASLAFSTVVPAVLETTELAASLRLGERLPSLPAWRLSGPTLLAFHLLGCLMLLAVVTAPRYAFPLAWLSVFFIVEPFNTALGQRSVGWYVRRGCWAAVWNLMLATLATGFFWEMWNSQALPKWYYTVPYVEFGHLFEMP